MGFFGNCHCQFGQGSSLTLSSEVHILNLNLYLGFP